MANYDKTAKTLFNSVAAGVSSAISGSGDSISNVVNGQSIGLNEVTDLALTVTVGAPTGTNPTLMVQVDMLDAAGNWILGVVKLAANITAAGTYVAYGGLHIGGAAAVVLTGRCRVSWTIGGTAGPSFPGVSICLAGR